MSTSCSLGRVHEKALSSDGRRCRRDRGLRQHGDVQQEGRGSAAGHGRSRKAATARERALDQQIADLQKKNADLDSKLKAALAERNSFQKSLDDTTALAGELKNRLEKLGQNVDKLTSEKGQLSRTLDDAKARLEELRKQKLAADARAATFHQLVEKLRSMIDAGQLKVIVRDGRMIIALDSDVLFDSGKTSIKPAGQTALARVAQVLAGITDRKYQVAGHTDDVPIHTARFPSNWSCRRRAPWR